jgi:Cof subfamily protein (haloacid dehalogenase superfamily)
VPPDGVPRPLAKLVCIDVDGTLVGVGGAVHDRVWPAVEAARAAGIRLAICSGRPGFGVTRALAAQLEPDGWHCFQNGASVVHLRHGESRSAVLLAETVSMLVERARRHGRPLELYSDDDYVTEHDSEMMRRHAGFLGIAFERRTFESLHGAAVRAQWVLTHAAAPAVLAEPHPGLEVSPSLAPAMPDGVFVNLTRAGVNKGMAVRAVAAEYGVSLEDVMYVGDGLNDTPALRIVGHPVAMANAEDVARELARETVGDVEHGGLADALDLAMNGRR